MFRGKTIKNTFATISASATFCAASIGSAARIARLRSGVLGALVGDPEQPGAERRGLLQLVQATKVRAKVSCSTSSPLITEPIRRAQ
jgi:hypothetical protein